MSISIGTTAKKIGMPTPSGHTIYNTGSDTIWIHTDITVTGFAGTEEVLAALSVIELQAGESVKIEKQLNDVLAVCGTGKSSTLRSIAGELGSGGVTNALLTSIDGDTGALHDTPTAVVSLSVVKALAGTPAPLALAATETFVSSFSVRAARAGADNVGDVFIGLMVDLESGVKNYWKLEKDQTFSKTAKLGEKLDMALWGIDGETAADGVMGTYDPI